MEAVREITVWDLDFQPNHTYLLDGERIVAYIPKGTGEIRVSKSGKVKLDRRNRKFEKVDIKLFGDLTTQKDPNIIEVMGSKGNSYFVNKEERTCTCPGYKFRGACKHIEQAHWEKSYA